MSHKTFSIHIYGEKETIITPNKWDWNHAERFLAKLGYNFDNDLATWVKPGFRAEIINKNGLPF